MLRAIFVIAIIAYGIARSLGGPFYALLFYLWLAYFRPEQWLWFDFVSQLNLSFIMGVVVLASTLMSGRRLRFGFAPNLMFLLLAQSLISTLLSPWFGWAWVYWQDFAKSTIISFLIISLVDDEKQLRLVLVVICASLGLEATKQGWAQLILNPGARNDNPVPILGDNNGVAVGMFMLVALMTSLARTSSSWREQWIHRFMAVGVLYRAIATYSRGGFLACGALGLHYLLRSKRKVGAIISIAAVVLLIAPVLPDSFWNRMSTIDDAVEEAPVSYSSKDARAADWSSRSRLHFWQVAVAMANANPLTGVGHNAYQLAYDSYDFLNGAYGAGRQVHSSFFAVLAELGYPGAVLFVLLIANALWACRKARRAAKRHPEMQNLAVFASAIEAAIVVFAVGGSFVNFQYTEMLWHSLALSMVIDRLVRERVAALEPPPKPFVLAGRLAAGMPQQSPAHVLRA